MNHEQLAQKNFYHEIKQPEEEINLAKAALYIAQTAYPELDPHPWLDTLDGMAREVGKRLKAERYPLRVIQKINQYLYSDLGFQGNSKDYYDPRNSFLNDVLERRKGIPITLSLVYLEIAQRLDFPMVGIGMPGHFLIRPDFTDAGVFVNAFNGGETLFEQDCEELLSRLYRQPVKLQAQYLEAVTKQQFLARMLTNLKFIYLNQKDLTKALAIVEMILLVFPSAAKEIRDRGLLCFELGKWERAKQDLEFYLAMVPDAGDFDIVKNILGKMT